MDNVGRGLLPAVFGSGALAEVLADSIEDANILTPPQRCPSQVSPLEQQFQKLCAELKKVVDDQVPSAAAPELQRKVQQIGAAFLSGETSLSSQQLQSQQSPAQTHSIRSHPASTTRGLENAKTDAKTIKIAATTCGLTDEDLLPLKKLSLDDMAMCADSLKEHMHQPGVLKGILLTWIHSRSMQY
ncbi:hypothetical protein PLESTB_000499300 [Pleodorina starrii]|uniref:Uncharacterized protein n=1 Tax=Pleodorina starrii TaxID=330485 RepID=A0A9W6BH59_9CHLO|nr:hypothetical protein PLESTM_000370700 [Pleodorina starrii]GLC51411.1 hypothetical protein PLESTB_000499300 [Pleodorina starrii]GLC63776.1 hypothetical protein PLESTF_000072800 [Pleodorina starrii]